MENPLRREIGVSSTGVAIVQCHFNPLIQLEPSKVMQLLQLCSEFIIPISNYNLKGSPVTALCCSAGRTPAVSQAILLKADPCSRTAWVSHLHGHLWNRIALDLGDFVQINALSWNANSSFHQHCNTVGCRHFSLKLHFPFYDLSFYHLFVQSLYDS